MVNSAPNPTSVENSCKTEQAEIPCWSEDQQAVLNLPVSAVNTLKHTDRPLLPSSYSDPKSRTPFEKNSRNIIFPLCPDHLITLLQYNVLRACIANRSLLSSPTTPTLCSSEALSVLPVTSLPKEIPLSLHPTHLQQTVPHEDWIDIIPHPQWRDNLIMAIGTFDEDELWSDTIGGLFEGFPQSEIEQRGVVVWSPTWHYSGWEVTEGFWRKWKWSMKGCENVVDATNHWRKLRGEEPLVF